ncbi:MAG: hypothetical protein IJP17_04680 [Clostridia bacterium]|nr:hypothetical protein [Clostridia bacterium]
MKCNFCGGEVNLSVGRCIACGKEADESFGVRIVHNISALADRYGIRVEEEEERDDEIVPELLKLNKEPETAPVPQKKKDAGTMQTFELPSSLAGLMDNANIQPVEFEPESVSSQEEADDDAPDDGALSKAYRKIDNVIAPSADKILDVYHKKVPRMKRAKQSTALERLAVVGVVLVLVVGIIAIIAAISNSLSQSLRGEWQISKTGSGEVLTIEFLPGREVEVRTYQDGKAHVYKTGEYKTQRKNGYNLLTITYDDGSESRLYYEIDGDEGIFTNVDSNRSEEYTRIKGVE